MEHLDEVYKYIDSVVQDMVRDLNFSKKRIRHLEQRLDWYIEQYTKERGVKVEEI